jgi:phosphoglycolate phosphatase
VPFLPNTQIEIVNPALVRGKIRHALFDFDGTLSLIRECWQDIMIPMMIEILSGLGTGESEDELRALVTEYVDRLTGKETIYQMRELCAAITQRGGQPLDPYDYKAEYNRRLLARINWRLKGLKSGAIPRTDLLVPGSLELLEALRARGVTLYVASGTDMEYVLDEVTSLGLQPYFGPCIYGALDHSSTHSKQAIIADIVRQNHLQGPEFVAFGDGFVELEEAKRVGGIAVGAATDEVNRAGVNTWKRNRLAGAGADVIVPDYRETGALVRYLWDEE